MRRPFRLIALAVLGTALSAAPAWASPFLIGTSVDVNLLSHGLGGPDPLIQSVLAGAGAEIAEGDGSAIGSGVMLDNEFIDIAQASVTFSLRGGGDPHSTPGFRLTGFPDTNALYRLYFDTSAVEVTGLLGLSTLNLTGVQVVFDFIGQYVQLNVGSLGVAETTNLGSLTVLLNVRELTTPPPPPQVPEPATLLLLGTGLSVLAVRRGLTARK